jgi:large subunit ribosomal protein L29
VKVNEFRELEEDQLGDRLRAARRELYELRFKHAVGQLENSSQISKVRHDIARIMTVISERELGLVTHIPAQETTPVAVAEKDEGFEPEASEEVASPPRGEVVLSSGAPAKSKTSWGKSAGGVVQQSKVVEATDAPKPKRVRKAKTEEKSS